jgi:hypothetical protein
MDGGWMDGWMGLHTTCQEIEIMARVYTFLRCIERKRDQSSNWKLKRRENRNRSRVFKSRWGNENPFGKTNLQIPSLI